MQPTATELNRWFGWAPDWLVIFAIFALAFAIAIIVHALIFRVVTRIVSEKDLFWRSLVKRTRGPWRLLFLILGLALASEFAPLNNSQSGVTQRILAIGIIALIAWMISITLRIWLTLYLRRFTQDNTDPFLSRKHVTQTHILQRVATFLIWMAAASAMLMTFESVRQYGVSMLASAGAAGLILGLALQPVLQNLIAGIQIAITQPVRIGDSLIVEGEYGTVEDIRATYVVIRLWDLRRLVIPLSYFLEKPFQNWTRDSTDLLGSSMFYLDHATPIAALRERAKEIVEASPLWDGKVFAVQVTEVKEQTMEVRVLVSSSDSGKLFDLRCEVREKIMELVQNEFAEALPKNRVTLARAG